MTEPSTRRGSDAEKQREVFVCVPCKQDHHLECANSKEKPCDCLVCLVCLGEEVGDVIVGDWSPRRRRTNRL